MDINKIRQITEAARERIKKEEREKKIREKRLAEEKEEKDIEGFTRKVEELSKRFEQAITDAAEKGEKQCDILCGEESVLTRSIITLAVEPFKDFTRIIKPYSVQGQNTYSGYPIAFTETHLSIRFMW